MLRKGDGRARRNAAGRVRRLWRKHRLAIVLCGTVLALLFVPPAFYGRVLSPNDVYYHYDPWRSFREVQAQNPVLSDPPISWMPLWDLVKRDPSAFHWNRYVGGGIPGWGSAASAVLSPVVLFPVLLLPLLLSYSGIVAAKIATAFVLAYGWLREERLGRRAAAVGALAYACSGIFAVWWLWQATNATVFYPAVVWVAVRTARGKRTPLALLVALALAMALSGYPAATAYGAWLGTLYFAFLVVLRRRVPWVGIARIAAAAILALAISAPLLAPFVEFLGRSGYLEGRAFVAENEVGVYPANHLLALIDPYRLGDPAQGLWNGDPALGPSNNFVESTVFLGIGPLVLILLGLWNRHRSRWFWIAFALLLLALMFGFWDALSAAAGTLPGIRYSPLARLRYLLPVAVAFLAAAGVAAVLRRSRPWRFRRAIPWIVGLAVALELALFAARFYPYLRPKIATIPSTAIVDAIRTDTRVSRVAPFFDALFPNSAELMRLEDVRSHFGSEEKWRALLHRFAPGSFGSSGTVIQFNSLHFDFDDPLVSALNIRWFVEQPSIDIVSWRIRERSALTEPHAGPLELWPGMDVRRQIDVTAGLQAIQLSIHALRSAAPGAALVVELIRPETGHRVWARRIGIREARSLPRVYVPIAPFAGEGEVLLLRIVPIGLYGSVPKGPSGLVAYDRSTSPVILHSVFRGGRLYENLAARERFYPVWKAKSLSFEEFVNDRTIDLGTTAVVMGEVSAEVSAMGQVPPPRRRANVRLRRWNGTTAVLETQAEVPFLLASSEKRTPELEVLVDGKTVDSIEINGMFAAVALPEGAHRVEFRRRIGRGWWSIALAALIVAVAGSLVDRRLALRARTRPARSELSR